MQNQRVSAKPWVRVPLYGTGAGGPSGTRGSFLEGPEKFSHPEGRSKISNLMITELFYSHILNIKRSSLHTRSFRRIYTSTFLDTDGLNMALRAQKVSGVFEKQAPG